MTDQPLSPEPELPAPGGRHRPSVTVDRGRIPALRVRERVETILRTHDFSEAERAFGQLTPEDLVVVRVIAQEGAASGVEPPVRYAAIAALARHPSAANLNLLTDLARLGEDFYVRGHAVLALAHTGSYAHLGAVLAALEATEPFERAAAVKALRHLAAVTSEEAVRAHALALGGEEAMRRLDAALAAAGRQAAEARRGPRVTEADPGGPATS
ncbi:HEAT repeat domain-containing protein [Streptomyces sp. B3I8]|uniref:HEAT repeat domain-containing protein n=1 Tax=Streptomyces sp. B3I8 TaxID=3042303 RepID=UPI0027814766|nr:HEAT repeat domain-containing protein [Streptomyces sp. B3I8]MDQ0784680.1 HEAT repeat protein [Streptomyces sp. B3I8]